MAGLLDRPEDYAAYMARLGRLPVGDERAEVPFDEWQHEQALRALREEMLTKPKPFQLPGALDQLSAMSPHAGAGTWGQPRPPAGFASPTLQPPQEDFSRRMTGGQSANIIDRRNDFSWRNVANMLYPPEKWSGWDY